MSALQKDPTTYFEERDLVEAMVLHAEVRDSEFLIVLVYQGDEAWSARRAGLKTGVRDVRLLRFGGVLGFEFEPRSTLLPAWKTIDKATPGNATITGVELQNADDQSKLQLILGSHGVVRFRFATLHESIRRLRSEGRLPDGDWRYVDADTGEELSFYHPFGDPPRVFGDLERG